MRGKTALLHSTAYLLTIGTSTYFAGGGHASYHTLAILAGWAAIPFLFAPHALTFFGPPLIQLVILAWLQSRRLEFRVLLPLLHVVGIILAVIFWTEGRSPHGPEAVISLLLLTTYWFFYLRR